MTVHFHTLSDAGSAKAYFRSADYHFEGAEHKAYWLGKGAELLGLTGEASPEHFERLIDNEHPHTGTPLTKARRADRDFARDMTVSLPKSVTLARTLGGDERIDEAVDRALDKMFAAMERDAGCRVRKNYSDTDRNTGNLVACVFPHRTSRPINGQPDPQEHRHVVILNLTYDHAEDQWKAVQFRNLLRDSGYYKALLWAYLSNELQQLGYETGKTKDAFEITGIPPTAIKQFSRRTAQIEKLADQLGIVKPESKAKLGATSREKKTKGLTWDDLLSLWSKRLKPAEMEAIHAAVRQADATLAMEDRTREAVTYALEHLTERQTVVPERKVVTEALRFGLGGVTPESVYAELGSRKDVIRRVKDGTPMVTTQQALAREKSIVAFAVKGRGRLRPLSSGSNVAHPSKADLSTLSPSQQAKGATRIGSKLNPTEHVLNLSPSQQAAIRHLWRSRDRIIIWEGKAGTGKTTALEVALSGIDVPWNAFATAVTASRGELRSRVAPEANTLSKLLTDEALQESVRNGLIVIDELSQTPVKQFAEVCQLAEQLNARILVVGDPKQHKSPLAGDVFRLLDMAGLPRAVISDIQRQVPGAYRDVAKLLADGKTNAALGQMLRHGWVREADSDALVADYLATLEKGKSGLIVCPTHAEGDRLTEAIRDRLKLGGRWEEQKDGTLIEVPRLTDEREVRRLRPIHMTQAELKEAKKNPEDGVVYQKFGAYREEKQKLGVGDVIRVTAPVKDFAGGTIDTGTVMTVTGWTDGNRMRVKTASGAERLLNPDAGHVAPAYTATSQAGQGRTVDSVLLWMPQATFPAVKQDTAYVSGTRGRQSVTAYTDDVDGLREAIQREDVRTSAMELVRINPKGIRQRLKRHVGFLRQLGREVKERTTEKVMQLTQQQERGRHL